MADIGRLQFSRQLQKLFGTRGAQSVQGELSVVPVVVLDADLPYRNCELWHGSYTVGAQGVGNFPFISISNEGPAGHVIVVERVRLNCPGAGAADFYIHVSSDNTQGLPLTAIMSRRDVETGIGLAGAGPIPEVRWRAGGSAVLNGERVPINSPGPLEVEGPWIIGSGGVVFLAFGIANVAMQCYAKGRSYQAS